MTRALVPAARIAGIATCVPARRFDNARDATAFSADEVRKVSAMAGVNARFVASDDECSTDLCKAAADLVLAESGCDPASVDALIMVTQTPDYLLPSSSCLLQARLGLSEECAAFDVNLGCSGYIYGLWLGATLLSSSGLRKVLLVHGETPTRYADASDRSVALLFGDAGSATILERAEGAGEWAFVLRTDGRGARDLIIEAGGFRKRFSDDRRENHVAMNGSNVFNFTISVLPPLIADTLECARRTAADVDYWIFHQSNRFILKHIMTKTAIPADRVPIVLGEFGNTGGPSVPLAITRGGLVRTRERSLTLMLLGYGVGLSWGSALVDLPPDAFLGHCELAQVT